MSCTWQVSPQRWLVTQEAEVDRQKTFLRLALRAAAKLPWTLPLMRSGGLLTTLSRLQNKPCAFELCAAPTGLWSVAAAA